MIDLTTIDLAHFLQHCNITLPNQSEGASVVTNPGVVFTRKDVNMIEAYSSQDARRVDSSSETLTLGLTWDTPDASTTWRVGYLASLALDKARYIEHVMNTLERMLEEGDIPKERIGVVRTLIEYLANYIADGNDVRYFECLLSKISSGLHQSSQAHAAHLSECYEQNG